MRNNEPPDAESADESGISFAHFRVFQRADGTPWELGRGGMGVTYRALDTTLRTEVALKVIRTERTLDQTFRQRFQREARSAAQIKHLNVASVYHLGEQDGDFFYAMEFIQGRTLDAVTKEHSGPFPPAAALALAAQTAAALTAAHRQQVIHRDLKPANLMVIEGAHLDHEDERTAAAGNRLIKVIDFGLARHFGEGRAEDSLVTQASPVFLGSPAYSSPEQCRMDDDIDGRTDLYSLGIILWELLAGQRPFGGRSSAEVLAKHQYVPAPLDQLAGLPAPIVALLEGLLVKDRTQRRPQTAAELRTALDGLWRGMTAIDGSKVGASSSKVAPSECQVTWLPGGLGEAYDILEQSSADGRQNAYLAADKIAGRRVRLSVLAQTNEAAPEVIAALEAQACRRAGLTRSPAVPSSILRVESVIRTNDLLACVEEHLPHATLAEVLRARAEARRTPGFAEALFVLEPISQALDFVLGADEKISPLRLAGIWLAGDQVTPPGAVENLIRPLGQWPNWRVRCSVMGLTAPRRDSALPDSSSQEISTTAEAGGAPASPAEALARLTYRILSGREIPLGASYAPDLYQPTIALSAGSNAFIRDLISGVSEARGSVQALQTLRKFEVSGRLEEPVRAVVETPMPPAPPEEPRASSSELPLHQIRFGERVVPAAEAPSPEPTNVSTPPPMHDRDAQKPSRALRTGIIWGSVAAVLALISYLAIASFNGRGKDGNASTPAPLALLPPPSTPPPAPIPVKPVATPAAPVAPFPSKTAESPATPKAESPVGTAPKPPARLPGLNPSVVVVDMKQFFDSYPKTKAAESEINTARNAAKKELEDRMAAYQKLSKEAGNAPAAQRDEKVAKLKSMERDIQDFQNTRQKQLEDKSATLRAEIVRDIEAAIGASPVAAEASFVFDKSGPSLNGVPVLLYAGLKLDASAPILKKLGVDVSQLTAAPASAPRGLRMASVDMKAVFDSFFKTKDAENRINEARNSAKKELEDRMDSYRTLTANMKKLNDDVAQGGLSQKSLDAKTKQRNDEVAELKSMEREIQEFTSSRQKELEDMSVRMRAGIVEEIQELTASIVKAEGADLVIDASGPSLNGTPVFFHLTEVPDWTPTIIRVLNSRKQGSKAESPGRASGTVSSSDLRFAVIDLVKVFETSPAVAKAAEAAAKYRAQQGATTPTDAVKAKEKELDDASVKARIDVVAQINNLLLQRAAQWNYNVVIDSSGNTLNGVPVALGKGGAPDLTKEIIAALGGKQ